MSILVFFIVIAMLFSSDGRAILWFLFKVAAVLVFLGLIAMAFLL